MRGTWCYYTAYCVFSRAIISSDPERASVVNYIHFTAVGHSMKNDNMNITAACKKKKENNDISVTIFLGE